MADEIAGWLKAQFNFSTMLRAAVLIGGWVFFFGTQRAALAEHDRRLAVLEAEIVPRAEHEAASRMAAEKEHLLESRLDNIERMLQEILLRDRDRR